MPEGAVLGTQFIKIEPDVSKVEPLMTAFENRVKKAGKTAKESLSSAASPTTGGLDAVFARADKALATFASSGTKSAKQLRPILVAQEEIRLEMEKGGVAAAKYGTRYAALTTQVAAAQKKFSIIDDAIKDQNSKLKDGQVQWQGWDQSVNIALGKFGARQQQALAFAGAAIAGFTVGNIIAHATGVDFSAQDQLLDRMQQKGRLAWKAVDDLGAAIINLAGDLYDFDTQHPDTRLRHLAEDARDAKAAMRELSQEGRGQTEAVRLGIQLPQVQRQAPSTLFGSALFPAASTKYLSQSSGLSEAGEAQAKRLGEVADLVSRAGTNGLKLYNAELGTAARSFEEWAAKADKLIPRLQKLAAINTKEGFESINNQITLTLQQAQIAADSHDYATANKKLIEARELTRLKHEALVTTKQQKDVDDAIQNKAGAALEIDRIGLQMSAKQQVAAVAAAAGHLEVARAREREIGTLQQQQMILQNMPKENIDAEMAAHNLKIQALDQEQRSREIGIIQIEIENARFDDQNEVILKLIKRRDALTLANARATNPSSVPAVKKQQEVAIDLEKARGIGDTIALKQLELETARVNADADAYQRLQKEIEEATLAKQRLGGGAGSSKEMLDAQDRLFVANHAAAERNAAADTKRTLLSLNQQITSIYQARGQNVAAELVEQAREQDRIEREALEASLDWQTKRKAKEQAAIDAILLARAQALNLKIQEIYFENDVSLRAMLDRQVRAIGTTNARIERSVGEAAGQMNTAFSDGFFDIATGRFDDLGKVAKSFLDNLLRDITNFLAEQAVKKLLELAFNFAAHYVGGSSIADSVNPALGPNGSPVGTDAIRPPANVSASSITRPPGYSSAMSAPYSGAVSVQNSRPPLIIHLSTVIAPDEMFVPAMAAKMRPFVQPSPRDIVAAVQGNYSANGVLRGTFKFGE